MIMTGWTDKSDSRRSDYDVTNTVQVSSPRAVAEAIGQLFAAAWPGASFDRVARAIDDLDALFAGRMPGYCGVDTVYHDRQHTLDMTLAMARLMAGYERLHTGDDALGSERATMGLVTSLFHDSGYIRDTSDREHRNGAEFTLYHVTRSARFLARYLPTIGLEDWVPVATRIVHFTGYEVQFDQIHLADARDRKLGHLLGTADLVAQMGDRCYLEKCRDRLYPEFVLGGVAMPASPAGRVSVKYSSGLDLLRQTPEFYEDVRAKRLDGEFDHAYRYVEPLFGGANPYMDAIHRNFDYLRLVLRTENWPLLRRNPPCFTWEQNPVQNIRSLMLGHLKEVWSRA
jgi:hypothetical protein